MLHDPKFWLAIAFFIFIGAAIKYVLPIIIKMIDGKRAFISEQIAKANEMRLKAENLLAEAEKYHKDSIVYSEELIEVAKKEVETILENSRKAIEDELNTKMELSSLKIKQEEEKVIRNLKLAIVEAAIKSIEQSLSKTENKKISENSTNQAIHNISKLIH
jgi:F-type H+-transporting ATPase subunit b